MQFNFDLLFQTLNRDMQAFLPEMLLCATIVLLLLLRLFSFLDRVHLGWVALLCTVRSLRSFPGSVDRIRSPRARRL